MGITVYLNCKRQPQSNYETNFWFQSGNEWDPGFHRGFRAKYDDVNFCEPRVCGYFNQILNPETLFYVLFYITEKAFCEFKKFD